MMNTAHVSVIAATPREGAAGTAQQKTGFFDLSGCREYVGSRDSVLTISDAPRRAYLAQDSEHFALRLRFIFVCRKAKKNGCSGKGSDR